MGGWGTKRFRCPAESESAVCPEARKKNRKNSENGKTNNNNNNNNNNKNSTPKSIKLKTFAHSEFSSEKFTNETVINSKIKDKMDLFERGHKYKRVELDNSFPEFIIRNKAKYNNWII